MKKYILGNEALEVYRAEGAFDTCVNGLKAEGLELITARQFAGARIAEATMLSFTGGWSWLAENFNYLPNGDILVASKTFNPLLRYPSFARLAIICHRNGGNFFLNDDVVSYLLEGAKQGGVLHLKREDVPNGIPTDAFSKEPFNLITDFLFKDKAEGYGQFLGARGIKNVPLNVVDEAYAQKQGKAFSRVLWIDNIGSSGLYGNDVGFLNFGFIGCAFGVKP